MTVKMEADALEKKLEEANGEITTLLRALKDIAGQRDKNCWRQGCTCAFDCAIFAIHRYEQRNPEMHACADCEKIAHLKYGLCDFCLKRKSIKRKEFLK